MTMNGTTRGASREWDHAGCKPSFRRKPESRQITGKTPVLLFLACTVVSWIPDQVRNDDEWDHAGCKP
ncbi:MAG TPA: hypothetical protein PKJ23_06535 [bacterium]|nr:hypothetical protein [bacterium]